METIQSSVKKLPIIGTGKLFFVDTTVMRRMGLNGEALAHEDHEGQIEAYREQGLIVVIWY